MPDERIKQNCACTKFCFKLEEDRANARQSGKAESFLGRARRIKPTPSKAGGERPREAIAAAKQTFPFLALLTSEYSAKQNAERISANSRVRVEGRTVLAQIISAWHTIYEIIQLGEINMRLRNVPGAREVMVENEYVFTEPEGMKGTWHEVFGNDNPVRIEIGMGKGRFISTLAAQNPDINYVGIEKYSSVLLRAVEKQEELQLPNLRFIRMDAENICEVFGAGEVDRIYLNFSDPWPKDRHAKRRLTSRQFFARYNVILKQDGQVEFKTDNKDLFDFSVEEVKEAEWKLTACTYDLHHDAALNEGNVMTEYEERFSKAGNPICKLIAKR